MILYHNKEVQTDLDAVPLSLLVINDGMPCDTRPVWTIKVTFEGRSESFTAAATPLGNDFSENDVDFGIVAAGVTDDYRIGQMDWDCFVAMYGPAYRTMWKRCRELRRKLIRLFGNHLNAFVDRTERNKW